MSSKLKFFIPAILTLILMVVYIHNLSRSVYGGDVGDLVTSSYVLGVAHPPGYPLFTFIGYLLTRIPLQTPAFMVGLISVFSSVGAVIIFYFLSLKLTKNILISLISTLVLAFSFLFWFYAEIAEVFALNNFFAILLFYFAITFRGNKSIKTFLIFIFFTGLSLTHHHTIILIFPSLFILVVKQFLELIKKDWKIVIHGIFFFLLGFSVYVYVPIASSGDPVINWDNVKDFNSFLQLLLRRDYGTFNAGVFNPPSSIQRVIIIKTYLLVLVNQLTPPVIFLIILGGISLFLKNRLLFLSLILGFLISGPLFVGYAGFPLVGTFFLGVYERFFVLSSVILLIFLPFGLLFLTDFFKKIFRKKFIPFFQAVFFIIPVLLFYYNFPKTNLSQIYLGDNLAYDFMFPLPKNSVLLLSGDTLLFNSWYMQHARGVRPDITIINFNGLAGDKNFKKEQEKVAKENPKFKKEKIIVETIKKINKSRPVFSYSDIQPVEKEKLIWVPYGLAYELVKSQENILPEKEFLERTEKIWKNLHVPYLDSKENLAHGSLSVSDLPYFYLNSLLAAGNFVIANYQDPKTGLEFYKKALRVNPDYEITYEILGVYYLSFDKKCDLAESNFLKAKELDPYKKMPYFFLYAIYGECIKNDMFAENITKDFTKQFKTDFYSELKKTMNKK